MIMVLVASSQYYDGKIMKYVITYCYAALNYDRGDKTLKLMHVR